MVAFPSTRISAVSASSSPDPGIRAEGFDRLVLAYWKPIYGYIRLRHNKDVEDACDLTQHFFAIAWEKKTFSKFDAGRGKFRTFVRVCIDRFVINEYEKSSRIKRGGAIQHQNIDFDAAEANIPALDSTKSDPERLFEKEWIRCLIGNAIARLRSDYSEAGKDKAFAVFEAYDLGDSLGEEISYKTLASRFDIPTSTVTNFLAAARRDLRRILLAMVRDESSNQVEFNDDIKLILDSFSNA